MRHKHIPLLVSILACVMIISVGFSSWISITPSGDATLDGTTSAYPVYETGRFVSNLSFDMFSFSSLSFLDSSRVASDTGTISVTYRVDIANCYSEIGSAAWDGKLTLLFSLWYSNPAIAVNDLFRTVNDETHIREVTVSASATVGTLTGGRDTGTDDYSVFNSTYTLQLPSGTVSGTTDVTLTYTFNIPQCLKNSTTPANFRQMLGKYLKAFADDKTEFLTSARVEEVE